MKSKVWILCILSSSFLNLLFFSLMPYLIRERPEKKMYFENISFVDVVRIRRERIEERRSVQKKQKIKKILKSRLYVSPDVKMDLNLNIPFDISPDLPKLPGISVNLKGVKLAEVKGIPSDLTLSLSEVDTPPIPISQIPPIYPISARIRGIEGWVKVRFVVDEEGKVRDIRIVESHPEGVFDDAVISCVSKWLFRPAEVGGIKVRTLVQTTIRFKLKE